VSLALRVWNANRGLLTFFLYNDDDLPAPLIHAFSLPVPLPVPERERETERERE